MQIFTLLLLDQTFFVHILYTFENHSCSESAFLEFVHFHVFLMNECSFFIQVNVHIAQQAGILHRTDLALKKHSAFFKLVGESVKNISDIDSKDWNSIKLATAAVIIRHPEKDFQHSQVKHNIL